MSKTNISWSEEVWNPLVGCTKVSAGCLNCYAMVMAARIANAALALRRAGRTLTQKQLAYLTVVKWERGGMDPADDTDKALPQWNGRIATVDETLIDPLRWDKPRRVFVNSMSDLFHPSVPLAFIEETFAIMAAAKRHTFQVLTKRPERMAEVVGRSDFQERVFAAKVRLYERSQDKNLRPGAYFSNLWPLQNVWLGTSVENQEAVDKRIPELMKAPAAVRFLSCEPLLGPLDLTNGSEQKWSVPTATDQHGNGVEWTDPGSDYAPVDWVIVGGESGVGHRPFDPQWARDIRDQCHRAGVAFFFKQHGGLRATDGGDLLDGVQHHAYPLSKVGR